MSIFDWQFFRGAIPTVLKDGLLNTLNLTIVTFIFACLIGLITALIKIYKIPVLYQISLVYVSFFRGTPLLVQILIFYYGLPTILNHYSTDYGWNVDISKIPPIIYMYVVFSLCYGAYISEVMRSAVLSVDKGQHEAAYTIGMSGPKVLSRIVFPQALSNALPNLGNYFVDIVKGTSLAFTATVVEILASAKIIGARDYRYFESYLAAAVVYWVVCLIFEVLFRTVEKRSRKYERRPA